MEGQGRGWWRERGKQKKHERANMFSCLLFLLHETFKLAKEFKYHLQTSPYYDETEIIYLEKTKQRCILHPYSQPTHISNFISIFCSRTLYIIYIHIWREGYTWRESERERERERERKKERDMKREREKERKRERERERERDAERERERDAEREKYKDIYSCRRVLRTRTVYLKLAHCVLMYVSSL